ncbi:MAG: hypothetical protein ABI199_10395 [Bacteroidia bacterium]
MKTKKILIKGLLSAAFLAFIFIGCKKNSDAPQDRDTESGADNAQASLFSQDASNIADNAAKGQTTYRPQQGGDNVLSTCATVKDSAHVLTINFGTTDCMCMDGRYRRGEIIVNYTNHYFDSASVRTITFSNYYVNENNVQGTKTVTNMGRNSSGQYFWSVNANIKITRADGKVHTWNANRTRTMVNGSITAYSPTDEYNVIGGSTGVDANGISYTTQITKPLDWVLDCHWIRSGTVNITPNGKSTRILDFGNGNCDNLATLTINGITYNITLP